MLNVSLVHQKMRDLSAAVNLDTLDGDDKQELELSLNAPFYVDYIDGDKKCIAHLGQKIISKDDPGKLKIEANIEGYFECEGIEDGEMKRQAHIICYYQLFPYMQSLIAQIFISAGLPPIMLRPRKISLDSVKINDGDKSTKME